MRDNTKLLDSMVPAVLERLNDPKNVLKGDFPDKLVEAIRLYRLEHDEIIQELLSYPHDFEKIRYEMADAIVCLSFGIQICNKLLTDIETVL